MLKATPSTSRSHERREGDKDRRRCFPSRPKPTTHVLDRRGVLGSISQYRLSSGAAVQQIRVGALSLMPSCLGIGGHPSGSLQGHPQYTGALIAGRLWVARLDQTGDTRQTVRSFKKQFCHLIMSVNNISPHVVSDPQYRRRNMCSVAVFAQGFAS